MKKIELVTKLRKIGLVLTLALITMNSLGANADELSDSLASSIYEVVDNPKYQEYLFEALRSLPVEVLNFLNIFHSKIVILPEEDSVEKKYEELFDKKYSGVGKGLSVPEQCIAFIEGNGYSGIYEEFENISSEFTEDEFNKIIVKGALFHEIGHLIDRLPVYSSTTDEFIKIYEEEKDYFRNTREFLIPNLSTESNIENSTEYFATAFSAFISYPDDLKYYCPKTYNYISLIIKQKGLYAQDIRETRIK